MSAAVTSSLSQNAADRIRIAIVSPDILARIKQVFADKNLDVDIVHMPYVEVEVRPVGGAPTTDRPVPEAVPDRRTGGLIRRGPRAARRLCAEYRLHVVGQSGETGPAAEPPSHHEPDPAPERPESSGPEESSLSRRQHEVMALVSRGARNAEIAERLRLSEKTVKNHLNRIFRQLGANSRVEAVVLWQRGQRDQRSGATPPSAAQRIGPASPVPIASSESRRRVTAVASAVPSSATFSRAWSARSAADHWDPSGHGILDRPARANAS
ncbi:LuxR C-terminal-related transcriptional regulator [Streptomyces catenulae]|uniref:LuxR C-terminal-related transcriptional regulator n=1 Tax=Streptomyces catenulae TaxID=66875 RepID=A0ABV2YSW1_9ACTN